MITLPDSLTIRELADKMKLQPSAIVKKLFLQGKVVTVNQEISYEQAEEIAIEYEIICEKEVKVDVIAELLVRHTGWAAAPGAMIAAVALLVLPVMWGLRETRPT